MELSTFAAACRNLGSPAHHLDAERALISLRSSPQAIETALNVLNSLKEDEVSCFHAAMLLRDSALRQYQSRGPETSIVLLNQCLDLSAQRDLRTSGGSAGDALLQACAAIFKRSFLENPSRKAFIERVAQMVCCQPTEYHGCRLMLHLVWEFSMNSNQSTWLGQSLEFHGKCARDFTSSFLRDIFQLMVAQLSDQSQHSVDMYGCLLDLIEEILLWPFDRYHVKEELPSGGVAVTPLVPIDYRAGTHQVRNSQKIISLPPSWAFVIESAPGIISNLSKLYQTLNTSPIEQQVKFKCRQVIHSFSKITGKNIMDATSRLGYCRLMTKIGYVLCETAFSKGDVNELADGCSTVSRVLLVQPWEVVLGSDEFIGTFAQLTQAVSGLMRQRTASRCGEDPFKIVGESLQELLSVWVIWISSSYQANLPLDAQASIKQHSSIVFEHVVQTELMLAKFRVSIQNECEEEEEEEENDETLSDLASIARANLHLSLPFMMKSLEEFKRGANGCSAETLAEQLGFLVELIACILADPDEGETSIIPRQVLEYSHQCQTSGNNDLVVAASGALLNMFEGETKNQSPIMSPLLSRLFLGSVRRWVASYLLPDQHLYSNAAHEEEYHSKNYGSDLSLTASIRNSFMTGDQPRYYLEFLVRLTFQHLIRFGNEESVTESAIQLLQVLSLKNKGSSPAWSELAMSNIQSMHTENWAPFDTISGKCHGDLNKVLMNTLPDGDKFDHACFAPCSSRFKRTLEQLHQTPSSTGVGHARRICDILCGLSRGWITGNDMSKHVRERLLSILPELCYLLQISTQNNQMADESLLHGVLQVFVDFTETQLCVCEAETIPFIFNHSKKVIEMLAEQQAKLMAIERQQAKNENALEEMMENRAESLNQILRLLIALTDRSAIDFSSADQDDVVSTEQDSSHIILMCIDIVLPLFSDEMFRYSTLLDKYFNLICTLCRTRPAYVLNLNDKLFGHICQALLFGCDHYETKIQRWCFESLASLSRYHHDRGSSHFSSQSLVYQLLLKMFTVVVFTSVDSSNLEPASLCILNLVMCSERQQVVIESMDAILSLCREQKREASALVDPQAEEARIQTLVNVLQLQFSKLFEGVRVHGGDRHDRKKFADNLKKFVSQVRGYVLLK